MNLKKKFASDVLFIGVSSGLLSVFGLITLPLLTKTLSPDLYGIWTQMCVTIGLLLTFVTFGFQTSVIRFLSGTNDRHKTSSLFHLMLGFVLLNSLFFVLVTFFFRHIFSEFIFGDISFSRFIPLTGLWLAMQGIYALNISFMRANNKIKLLSFINIIKSALDVLVVYFVLIVLSESLETVIILNICILFIFSTMIYMCEVVGTVGIYIKVHDFGNTSKDLFKFSLPFIPNGALLWILASSDRYFIVHLLSLSENAIYSVAYSLVNILSIFYMPLGFVAYPLLVRFWEENQKQTAKSIFEKSTKIYIFLVIPSIFGLYALGSKLILILATSDYLVSSTLILWIALGLLFLGIYQINVYIIHLVKKTYYNTIIFSIAAIINIMLNYIFIKFIGIEGAAISTSISYLFLAIIVTLIARKELRYTFDFKFMVKCIFASMVMYTIIKQIVIYNPFMILVAVSIGIITYLVSTITLHTFTQEDVEDMKQLLK